MAETLRRKCRSVAIADAIREYSVTKWYKVQQRYFRCSPNSAIVADALDSLISNGIVIQEVNETSDYDDLSIVHMQFIVRNFWFAEAKHAAFSFVFSSSCGKLWPNYINEIRIAPQMVRRYIIITDWSVAG